MYTIITIILFSPVRPKRFFSPSSPRPRPGPVCVGTYFSIRNVCDKHRATALNSSRCSRLFFIRVSVISFFFSFSNSDDFYLERNFSWSRSRHVRVRCSVMANGEIRTKTNKKTIYGRRLNLKTITLSRVIETSVF